MELRAVLYDCLYGCSLEFRRCLYAVGVRNGQLAESLSVLHRAALAAICHVPTRRRDRGERQT
jgi:hypothetical protein